MNCRDCEQLLEEYLDGELDARRHAEVGAHAASCAACSESYEALAAEQSLYARYERGVEVTPRLWAAVEERIAARTESVGKVGLLRRLRAQLAPLLVAPRFSPALTAALVLVAILGTAGVMRFTGGDRDNPAQTIAANAAGDAGRASATPQQALNAQPPAPATPAPEPTATTVNAVGNASDAGRKGDPTHEAAPQKKIEREQKQPAPAPLNAGAQVQLASAERSARAPQAATPDQLIREAEQRYVAAIKMLSRDVNSRRPRLDPQTVARFDQSLASIDRTISETRRAVNAKNGDPVAVQYMLSAYAKKVEVLREMAQLEIR